jgi:hypothetical protein
MPHQVTVTAKTGPDRTNTAAVIPNVTRIDFDLNDRTVQVYADNQSGNQIKEYELTTAATVTFTNTAGNYSIVIA